jgi:hypothetical protein
MLAVGGGDLSDARVSSCELIKLLESEAEADLKSLDSITQDESQITLEHVANWYFETEKLIRVLANTLPSSMAQPINQLRYAGHHLLKIQLLEQFDFNSKSSNLIEAYKHCKRAYFDAIDLYVYHLSETYRDKLALLPIEQSRNLAILITGHLEAIQNARFDSLSRIEYYNRVRSELISGLKLIQQVNEALAESGITPAMLDDRAKLISENSKLKDQINHQLKAGEKKFNYWMLGITAVIVIVTGLGLVFQGAGTQSFWKSEHYLHIEGKQSLIEPSCNSCKQSSMAKAPIGVENSYYVGKR